MKISSVNNVNFGLKFFKKHTKAQQNQSQESNKTDNSSAYYMQYLLDDSGLTSTRPSLDDRKALKDVCANFTNEGGKLYDMGFEVAKLAGDSKVQTWHFYLAALIKFKNYLAQVQAGDVDPMDETIYSTANSVNYIILGEESFIWNNPKLVNELTKAIDEQIKDVSSAYINPDSKKLPRRIVKPTITAEAISDIIENANMYKIENGKTDFSDNFWFAVPTFSQDKLLKDMHKDLCYKLEFIGKTERYDSKEKHHIEFYDSKADSIWKNISHGNSVLVLSDAENADSYSYLKKSFINLINKPGQQYNSIDPEKTNIITLNDSASLIFLDKVVRNIKADKSKNGTTTVIIGDLSKMIKNSGGLMCMDDINLLTAPKSDNPNDPNILYVLSLTPAIYHKNTQPQAVLSKVINAFAQQTLPLLNATDTKKYLTNENGLSFVEARIGKKATPDAINKAVEVTTSKNGNYPEKALTLLDSAGKFFVDEHEIKAEHVDAYLKETESLSESSDTDERTIIFDTGKSLSDIKGMPMTTAEAQSIVRQIKNGTVGTRGFVLRHNQGGSYGGGRRHTAEAIAGETQIPMVLINAKDFALKDIDALSQEAGLSELKIKKLIQTARAQAEANDLNTAMIFIENFDNFGSNPLWGISSIYEQKAFTQLMAEMDAARKEGKVNLIVMGSMNMPDTLDENILKPYKFLNQVVVYQPQDATQRREILDYYIEKNGYNIANNFEGQRETILNNISESTQYFSVVDLMYLLDQANIISKEREKDAIDGADFTESFLQISSGRTNTAEVSDFRKKIVTSHETGHALNLHLMYEIAKKQDIPWHLPQKVDFITLDPRGDFGGAMFFKESENDEYSFERILSDIVTDYGGHSAENTIYGMRGSWGISEDMRMADYSAKLAVTVMGMGQKTGVRHMAQDGFLSDIQKENVANDVDKILKLGKEISDMISETYKEFILEFTDRHYSKVATGECIISASQFVGELNTWRENQTPEKQDELLQLEKNILAKMEEFKKA